MNKSLALAVGVCTVFLSVAAPDAGLIGAARRVEHYEMAAYGAVSEFAKVLGEPSTLLCWKRLSQKKSKPTKS